MITQPDHLLTLAEWEGLPEDNSRHFELQEGVLIGSPKAPFRHQQAVLDIMIQLQPEFPATVRVPDVVVVRKALLNANLPRLVADQVLVAVEVIAPGSRAVDTLAKPADYAEAGIPCYWVVDLDNGPSLTAYHRAGDVSTRRSPRSLTGSRQRNRSRCGSS